MQKYLGFCFGWFNMGSCDVEKRILALGLCSI